MVGVAVPTQPFRKAKTVRIRSVLLTATMLVAVAAPVLTASPASAKDKWCPSLKAVAAKINKMDTAASDPWTPQRLAMVETQIVARGLTDERVLGAMRRVPRHRFVPAELQARLAAFTTLRLDSRTIVQEFDRPARDERRARQRAGDPPAPTPEPEMAPDEPADERRRAPSAAQQKNRTVLAELEDAKVLRAVYSERQLEAVLTDVWFNHFNVFAGKGQTRSYLTSYERDAIRPHVLGRFRDLLGATARHPAMLFYLDNWENVDPDAGPRARPSACYTCRAMSRFTSLIRASSRR